MNKELEPNSKLSHYRIVSKIGAGGMGEVYLAQDTKLDRKVAIKVMHSDLGFNTDKLKRFIQEAKAVSALNHPNILTVFEIGEAAGKNYLVTELIDGATLREHLLPHEPMRIKTVLKVVIQTADALEAAHRAGIIHRDIKPENIMIRTDGYAKVVDFGLAKLTETAAMTGEDATLAHVVTTPGIVMGTVAYMSPEQARGRDLDTRSDLFSLGVVLYELLTGRRPFAGETSNHVIVEIIEKEPPQIFTAGSEMPLELEKITLRLLEKSPERRYQTAADLAADLRALRKRLEFEEELERTSSPDGGIDATTRIFRQELSNPAESGNTIAVLPFLNMSRGEDGDYFSDGLAVELLNVLSKIPGLRVAARTSAFSFKGHPTTIAEIGRVLNVSTVLEGSIRMAGNRVRISVELIKVSDGYHLWSETYDRKMDDIFAVQDDIAQSVVGELRSRFLGETLDSDATGQVRSDVAGAVKGRAANPEAQRLMLLGRYFLDRMTREDTAKGIVYFKEALDLDGRYSLCWAELGRAYSIEAGRAWVAVEAGFELARDAAKRSLEIEPGLAEGHALLGRIQITHDLDLSGAEVSYKRALDLAPGSSDVLDGVGVLYYKLGRLDEALELARRVLIQDPLSASFWHNLGLTSHAAGMLAESEKAFARAIELAPQRFVSAALLALVLMEQGRIAEALEQAMREPDEFWRLWALAIVHHVAGQDAESDQEIEVLIEEHAKSNDYQIAEIFSMRGEKEKAFEWLERAIVDRDAGITHAKVNPRFRPLNGDPRWPVILKKIGFES
ncbi:hypothetical protein BH10ACI2_BH10ACI2_24770 [soil metagenome]